MKRNLSIFFVVFFCWAKAFAGPPLVIGTTSGYAPYVSLDAKGEYEGFDIDMAKLLAEKLNRTLVLKDLGSMPSLMVGLKQGKIDALIWAVSITEERMKAFEMVYYQGEKETQMPFLFWKEIPATIQSIEDFEKDVKKVICIESGTWQASVLEKFPKVSIKNLDKIMDGMMEIKYGKSWAVAIDPSLVPRFTAQYSEIKVLNVSLPSSEQSLGNGICIAKTNQKLAGEVKIAIEELRLEGKIRELEKKWNLIKEGGEL